MIAGLAVLLDDHNARVVMLGSGALGAVCGLLGTFLVLRRRALLGDAISHAALPGVALGFIAGLVFAGADSARSLPWLLAGGALGGALGVAATELLRRATLLRDDARLAIVLSVFFGAGVVLLSVIQSLPTGHAAGLEGLIYGRTATMLARDAWLIAIVAVVTTALGLCFARGWKVLCFDEEFARAVGLRVARFDAALMALATLVTVAGMQAVGLILVVALQVIPAAAARFWSDRLSLCVVLAMGLGASSGVIGAALSALLPNLPSGAVIVLVAAALFVMSLLFGPAHGMAWRGLLHWRAAREMALEHLLRAQFEAVEADGKGDAMTSATSGAAASFLSHDNSAFSSHGGVTLEAIQARRRFRPPALRRAVSMALRRRLIWRDAGARLHFTDAGWQEAARLTARHRLWEHFLIERAGVQASHVDRDADMVEHVLSPALLARIERAIGFCGALPRDPHSSRDMAHGSSSALPRSESPVPSANTPSRTTETWSHRSDAPPHSNAVQPHTPRDPPSAGECDTPGPQAAPHDPEVHQR